MRPYHIHRTIKLFPKPNQDIPYKKIMDIGTFLPILSFWKIIKSGTTAKSLRCIFLYTKLCHHVVHHISLYKYDIFVQEFTIKFVKEFVQSTNILYFTIGHISYGFKMSDKKHDFSEFLPSHSHFSQYLEVEIGIHFSRSIYVKVKMNDSSTPWLLLVAFETQY